MGKYIRYFFFISIIAVCGNAVAQTAAPSSLLDERGTPLFARHYIAMEGSPYLYEQFIPGKAITDKGKIYDNLKLRYNAYDNMLSFVYKKDDEPMRFEEPIKTFTLFTEPTMTFVSGYPKADRQTPDTFYQVLNYGKLTLLKYYRKEVRDSRNLAVAGVKGSYENFITFYTFNNNHMVKLKITRSNILNVMVDKKQEMETYFTNSHPDLKQDADLRKLFSYYNSL